MLSDTRILDLQPFARPGAFPAFSALQRDSNSSQYDISQGDGFSSTNQRNPTTMVSFCRAKPGRLTAARMGMGYFNKFLTNTIYGINWKFYIYHLLSSFHSFSSVNRATISYSFSSHNRETIFNTFSSVNGRTIFCSTRDNAPWYHTYQTPTSFFTHLSRSQAQWPIGCL